MSQHTLPTPLPRYIVIEGPIGVGKTTLTKRLADFLNAQTVFEVFEENPFLADFYKDSDRFAFQTEMFFLLSRYKQQQQFREDKNKTTFSVSDYLFRKCKIFASMTLPGPEFELFDKVYSILDDNIPKPDLVIYLHGPVDFLLQRIQQRGRPYEQELEADYLKNLHERYMALFASYHEAPLLKINNSNIDFAHDDNAIVGLLHEISHVYKTQRLL